MPSEPPQPAVPGPDAPASATPPAGAVLRALLLQGHGLPDDVWRGRHRFLTWVVFAHAAALGLLAYGRGLGPAVAVAEFSLVAALGAVASWPALSRRANSCAVALALALSSILLAQASGGRTEAYFHSFLVIALVALYEEWTPFLVALLYTGLGLLAHAAIQPAWADVAGEAAQTPWRWGLVHIVALLAEGVVLAALWTGSEHLRTRSEVVLDSAGEAVLGLSRHGQVTFANPAAARLLGLRSHQMIGRDARALLRGLPVALEASAAPQRGELRAGPARSTVEWTVAPKVRGDVTIGWVVVLRDVTARRDLEEQVEARSQQQAVVARLGHEALNAQGLDEFLAKVAREVSSTLRVEFCKLLELDRARKEFVLRAGVGWRPGLVGNLRFPADLTSQSGYTLSQDAPVVVEDLRADARFRGAELLQAHQVVSGMSVVIKGRDGPFGVLGVHTGRPRRFSEHDIHFLQAVANLLASAVERHRVEAELRQHRANLEDLVAQRTAALTQANRELEAFSYTVSHDLRSPLRSIDGFSRILRARHRDTLPEDSQQLLDLLCTGAQRMGSLIESVLSLTRIGRQELADEPLDLSTMAQEVLAGLRARDPARRVQWSIEPGLMAHGDPGLVRLALENLLANAWKFTGKVDPAHIAVRRVKGGATDVFVVEDNGAGFDMAHAKELFQPFHRLHEPAQFEGTGIGLATVARVVRRHGGHIWAQAEVGGGAAFYFTLEPGPLPDGAAGAAGTPAWREATEPPSEGPGFDVVVPRSF